MSENPYQVSGWKRALQRVAATRFGGWFYANVAPKIDRPLVRLTKGRLSMGVGHPVGLITMIGAKSGQPRTTPLLCTPDGDNWLVVASNGGSTKNPAWLYNLRVHPEITMLIQGREGQYIAHETKGAERAEAWRKVSAFYIGYPKYAERSGREIPVFVLKPKGE